MKDAGLAVGLALDLVSPLFQQLIEGVAEYVLRENLPWTLQVVNILNIVHDDAPIPPVDAAIVAPPVNAFFSRSDLPWVLVQSERSICNVAADTLVIDQVSLISLAVAHLKRRGLKRIGFVSGPRTRGLAWIEERESAFQVACESLALPSANVFKPTAAVDADRARLLSEMGEWVEALGTPCGIVALDDFRALDVQITCLSHGLRMPEEVALVGIGNLPTICPYARPPLTSVGQNFRGIGQTAAAMLARRLKKRSLKRETQIFRDFNLHRRASTDLFSITDPVVASVMGQIRVRCGEQIGSAEIVAASGLNHSSLNRHFREALGMTVQETLQAERIRRARRLLVGTPPIPLKEIADRCGFQNVQYFTTVFRKAEGMTPGALRKRNSV